MDLADARMAQPHTEEFMKRGVSRIIGADAHDYQVSDRQSGPARSEVVGPWVTE